jgi:hypothetical protein
VSKIDHTAQTVTIDRDGLVRVDGVVVFRLIHRGDTLFAQFLDSDRLRSQCRGARYIEVPWDALAEKLVRKGREIYP